MKKIFDDAVDKNVAKVVVFADTNKDLFYDAEFTEEVPDKDGLNLFVKGVVCLYNGSYYAPVSCTSAGAISFGI